MLTAKARSRLAVVLVGARNPQNIGAVARAMQDFGFSDLRIVNEFAPPFEAAQLEATSAVGAGEVMRSARRFVQLSDAIADCGLVAGTTAIGGRQLDGPIVSLQEAVPQLLAALETLAASTPLDTDPMAAQSAHMDESGRTVSRAALLFGSEKTGLSNEHLSFCSLLLTVPLYAPDGRHLSMNLGQAAAVCLYELTRNGFEGSRALLTSQEVPATVQDRERLLVLLRETMEAADYSRRFPANARPEVVRHLVHRLTATRDEAATWMGIFKLILRRMAAHTQDEEQR